MTNEKEAIVKEVRTMIHDNRNNGDILEQLQSEYGDEYSDADLKKMIQVASN